MKRRSQRIRSELVANRENQPNFRKRIRREPFGIYRPLTEESKTRLMDILLDTQEDINGAVWWKDGVKFETPIDLGVTFISKRHIARAMRRGSLQRGFNAEKVAARFQEEEELKSSSLELSLAELDWFGDHGRKMVSKFDSTPNYIDLLKQHDKVVNIMDEMGAETSEFGVIPDPDHMTLFRYGSLRDFINEEAARRHTLTERQREEIGEIVAGHLADAHISSVVLGGIVMGQGYSSPTYNVGAEVA